MLHPQRNLFKVYFSFIYILVHFTGKNICRGQPLYKEAKLIFNLFLTA